MSLLIRKAEEQDISVLLILLEEVLDVHHSIRPDIFVANSTKYTKEELIQKLNNKDEYIFVGIKDDKVIASLYSLKKETNSNNLKPLKILYIDDLCVESSSRHLGVGKEMLDFIKDFAKKEEFDEITLNVWEGNDSAYNFYRKSEFKEKRRELEFKVK